jgi:hypothetical protein
MARQETRTSPPTDPADAVGSAVPFLQTFKEFPPSQKAASFTIDQALANERGCQRRGTLRGLGKAKEARVEGRVPRENSAWHSSLDSPYLTPEARPVE